MPQTQYSLHLKGFVGGADFDRNFVDYVLGKNKDMTVNVLIDSLGGSLVTALSIAAAFRNHAKVNVHFVGMNASAATIASLGAQHISIDANAMYLVHKCSASFFEWGSLNADQFTQLIAECEKIKEDLDKFDINIASMYSAKCKKSTKELLDLMQKGGWLSAKEALDWGFVDEITNLPEEAAPKLTEDIASVMAEAGLPIPEIPFSKSEAEKNSVWARFLNSLTSLFNAHKLNIPAAMKKTYTFICAVLGLTEIALNDNSASLSDDQLSALEDHIAKLDDMVKERDNTIASLNAQIAAFNGKPGDTSTQVVDDSNKTDAENALDEYCKHLSEAKAMFNAIS